MTTVTGNAGQISKKDNDAKDGDNCDNHNDISRNDNWKWYYTVRDCNIKDDDGDSDKNDDIENDDDKYKC